MVVNNGSFPSLRQRFEALGFTVQIGAIDEKGHPWRYKAVRGGIIEYYAGPGELLKALKRWETAIANAPR